MARDAHTTEAEGVPALEQRLTDDEARLARDEARLSYDEARLEAEEAEVRESRIVAWFGVGLALALIVAVTALIIGVIALREDVSTIRRAAADDSVATAAIEDGAVTSDKLADGAITQGAIASGAIGTAQIQPGAVTGAQIARDSLTGADIRERTLAAVPVARRARTALDSSRLGGLPARVYVSSVVDVRAASLTDARRIKGPLTARCPAGSRVISGGAEIRGALRGAAIIANTPDGESTWTATARVARTPAPAWQLVVTAVCAQGGA
jgi:hypothetical protein